MWHDNMMWDPRSMIWYPRKPKRDPLRTVGMVATGLGALALLGVMGMVLMSIPEIKRYLKMERM
jgi:hypothetical protein